MTAKEKVLKHCPDAVCSQIIYNDKWFIEDNVFNLNNGKTFITQDEAWEYALFIINENDF